VPSPTVSTGGGVRAGGLTTALTVGFVSFRGREAFALERNESEIFVCATEREVVGAIVSWSGRKRRLKCKERVRKSSDQKVTCRVGW